MDGTKTMPVSFLPGNQPLDGWSRLRVFAFDTSGVLFHL